MADYKDIIAGTISNLMGKVKEVAENPNVKEAVDKDGFLGILTGGLTASAGGICAAIVFGLLASLLFKPKDKA